MEENKNIYKGAEEITREVEDKNLLGHPIGLFYLFFAELWERFSYYGMRALLVLYVVDQYFQGLTTGEREIKAYGIFGAYGALVYATPILGGMIADKLIGNRKAILLGGVIMALGHFFMAIETPLFFYTALGLLVVGNGFFKPNISALVGSLYKEGDPRRDGGFTIFYMGVNVGAMIAPLLCGWLGQTYGWHYGFGAAGVGMLLGLVLFMIGIRDNALGNAGHQPEETKSKKIIGIPLDKVVYTLAFLVVPLFSMLIFKNEMEVLGGELMSRISTLILIVVTALLLFYIIQMQKIERERMIVVVILTFFITVFWSFFEQSGSSLTLFAEKNVNLTFLTSSQAQAINPFFIMVLAFPFSYLWVWLSKHKMNPTTPVKSALGIAQLGLGFLLFAYSAQFMDDAGKVPFVFLVLGYFFMTTGELFISPIGLSKTTELAPAKIVAFMLGVFYLSSSFAHFIAGQIAKLTAFSTSSNGEQGVMTDMITKITGFESGVAKSATEGIQSLATYTNVFSQIAIISFGCAIIILILSPFIKRLMHGVH